MSESYHILIKLCGWGATSSWESSSTVFWNGLTVHNWKFFLLAEALPNANILRRTALNYDQLWLVIPAQKQGSGWCVWATARGRSRWRRVECSETGGQQGGWARPGSALGSWQTLWQFYFEWDGNTAGFLWARGIEVFLLIFLGVL